MTCSAPTGDVELRASSGSKRVHGPRTLPPPPASPRCLLLQELVGPCASQRAHRWHSYSRFQLLHEWDCYAGQGDHWPPFFLRRRSPVREVVGAEGLVFALCESGVCTAFLDTGQPLCYLNLEADEIIRSLFYNPLSASLITVSVFSGDAFQRLKVRTTPLTSIRAGTPEAGWRPLFASEVLAWPGFVEFDDVNHVVVTCCAQTRQFKVWDLRAPYHPLYRIDGGRVQDLKVANAAVLLTLEPERPGELLLRVLDLADGGCLQEVCLAPDRSLPPGDPGWELVELFGRHLLTKAVGGPLRILDLASGAGREVSAAQFPAPEAFIHLPFNHALLAFWSHSDAQLWSLQGQLLATLAHARLSPACGSNTVFISDDQSLLFFYCPPTEQRTGAGQEDPGGWSGAALAAQAGMQWGSCDGQNDGREGAGGEDRTHLGCVRVFDMLTGRQVAVVQPPPPAGTIEQKQGGVAGHSRPSAAAAALAHTQALFYDAHSHRLYTGTSDGRVQAWGV